MPIYNQGRIVLSREESALFRDRLDNPDCAVLDRRDAFLREIEQTLHIEQTSDGVYLGAVDLPHSTSIFTESVYSVKVQLDGGFSVQTFGALIVDKFKSEDTGMTEKVPISYAFKDTIIGSSIGALPDCA